MPTTQSEITEERLREMLAGLEGVTPGPWRRMESGSNTFIVGHPEWPCRRNGVEGQWEVARLDDMVEEHPDEVKANARHIARCDPDTMRQVLTLALSTLTRRCV